jgi:hypothetical protein
MKLLITLTGNNTAVVKLPRNMVINQLRFTQVMIYNDSIVFDATQSVVYFSVSGFDTSFDVSNNAPYTFCVAPVYSNSWFLWDRALNSYDSVPDFPQEQNQLYIRAFIKGGAVNALNTSKISFEIEFD